MVNHTQGWFLASSPVFRERFYCSNTFNHQRPSTNLQSHNEMAGNIFMRPSNSTFLHAVNNSEIEMHLDF